MLNLTSLSPPVFVTPSQRVGRPLTHRAGYIPTIPAVQNPRTLGPVLEPPSAALTHLLEELPPELVRVLRLGVLDERAQDLVHLGAGVPQTARSLEGIMVLFKFTPSSLSLSFSLSSFL